MDKRDTQVVEIVGRNRLINELLAAGFEVAQPLRDHGVDLIAYLDKDDSFDRFIAFPIQLKVATIGSFSVSRKYDKFPNLIHAYVWGVGSTSLEAITYGLTQTEAVDIATKLGWTENKSWINKGIYKRTTPTDALRELLRGHQMSPEAWRHKLLSTAFPSM